MMKHVFTFLLTAGVLCCSFLAAQGVQHRRYDFRDHVKLKKIWARKGKQFGVPMTRFFIVSSADAQDKKALAVEANNSSGVLVTRIPEEVWRKYPVMRWRWRVIRKVRFSGKEPDDQAAVIYFGDGTPLKQHLMAYRWEHDADLGSASKLSYGMGATTVARICVRNGKAEYSRWYEEERNVVEDFRKAFGRAPKGRCGLTIGANSQHSKSNTLVEIDFIEFRKTPKSPATDLDGKINIAERKTANEIF